MIHRKHPAGRGLTFAASPGHERHTDLPALPGDFCWTYAELAAPAHVAMTQLERTNRD